jgi:lipoyl-dependent peroxiredoxin
MPRIERTARVSWTGNAARGEGAITAGTSGAFEALPFSLPTRIGQAAGKTSPEELLASELTQAGTPPGTLDVTCRIVMDEVEGQGHQIVASFVDATVAVDGVDDAALEAALAKADAGCPFSQLLRRAGADVHVAARLA